MTLSTPMIWVVFPLAVAAACIALHTRRILSFSLACGTAFGLALLATFLSEEMILSLGPLTVIIEESLGFLGRRITLTYAILPFIAFIYATTGFWLLCSNLPGVPKTFRPISLVVTACLTAALGVEPFLYAALLIQTAVLVSVPMQTTPDTENHRGILRYIGLMTLAMPFVLIAGWLLTGVVILPPDSPLILQSAIVLGLGFALWLAVFPFHSWVPMVSQRSHPMVVSFLLFVIPTTILVFGLNFLNRYAFLRTSETIFNIIRIIGVVMIVFGGFWAAAEDHLKRAFGFSVLIETGFSLLAVGLFTSGGLNWLLMLFPVRALGYWLWGYTLSRLEEHIDSLDMQAIQGLARQLPLLSAGLLFAQLSIAGLPLLASFPVKIRLLTLAVGQGTLLGVWSFFGSLGLFLFSIRLLLNLLLPNDTDTGQIWFFNESRSQYLPVLLMIAALVIFGLFPEVFSSGLIGILTAFPQLQ